MPKLTWNDAESIGIELFEKYPEVDPLKTRFTEMHQWITELADFEDDPMKSNEAKLEAIQMAWYDEWKENQ